MEHFALAVIGSGSGNVVIPEDVSLDKVALIEAWQFGGTCVNRGCIPTKMFAYTADLATQIRQMAQFGLRATLDSVDWPAIRDRVLSRVEQTSREGRDARIAANAITFFEGRACFRGPHELVIDDQMAIEADQIVIATGGRPSIPSIVAESGVEYHTSDTIMRLDALPDNMVIVGGGYVAVELAHIFCSLGVKIFLVETAATLMATLDTDLSSRFTMHAKARWDVHLDATITEVREDDNEVVVVLADGTRVAAQVLLVASGRQPNTENLGLQFAGVHLNDDGRIVVDKFGQAAPGIWALGDCCSPFELKHVANAEARTICHNLTHPTDLHVLPHEWVPSAVFSEPQIASVGARAQDLDGTEYVEAIQEYSETAFGWALQDDIGVCKLYADPETGTLLGAHILGYQASVLITPLIQAVAHGQRVADLARGQYWIHPALGEVVENALLKLDVGGGVVSRQIH